MDPAVMLGKPVIRGTRVTVEQVLRELGAGMSVGPGTAMAEPTELPWPPMHCAETVGQ